MAIVIVLCMLGASAFFSASEIAFVAANRLKVEVKARQRGMVGRHILNFFEKPADFLTTVLVGNNVALVVYSTIMAVHLKTPLEQFLQDQLQVPAGGLDVGVLLAQSVLAGIIVLFVGEILPKTITREVADRVLTFLALPLVAARTVLLPLVSVAGWASRMLVRVLEADEVPLAQLPRRAFELVIEEGRQSGSLGLDEDETMLLTNVFDLHAKRVKESMTPRTEIVAADESTTLEAFRALCIESGFSKLPVYRQNIDNVIGIAFAYDLFNNPAALSDIVRPIKFVPGAKPSRKLFREFRETNSSIVIVIDEYGGTAGLVTREDLLEELFGDIQDEFDSEDVLIRKLDAHNYQMSGRAEIDEINELYGLKLPTGDYDTIAGLLLEHTGTIPEPQEEFEVGGFRLTVLQATSSRVDLLKITVSARN